MATVRVTAPIAVTGEVVGVAFVQGMAEVDPADYRRALAYFRRHGGYQVEPATASVGFADEPPAPSAVKAEWVGYAVRVHDAGPDEAEAMTKTDLIDRYGPKPE
nr:hypothetical protein [Salinispora mooreana]